MTFETKMKKRIDNKLNAMVKNPYQKEVVNHPFPLWAKIVLPLSCLATASVVALVAFAPKVKNDGPTQLGNLTALVTPTKKSATNVNEKQMSVTTFNSYKAFSKKFVSLMMQVNNSEDEKSMSVSIPDAYLCLAITGIISSTEAMNDVISYLELNNVDELKTAAREIIKTLCTLYKDKEGLVSGGYNLNSVWLNPDMVKELENKDAELYQDLKDVFDVAIFINDLNNVTAKEYMDAYAPEGFKNPEPNLPDAPKPFSVMSGYYCLDSFTDDAKEYLKNQCESGTHKIDYTFNGTNKAVNYYKVDIDSTVFEGSNFYGSIMPINHLNIAYFLPNNVNDMPSAILNDVLNENYSVKQGTYRGEPAGLHHVTFSAPYFSIDNQLTLEHPQLANILPVISTRGAGARICEALTGEDMLLKFIKQFSTMTFDYNGFYSASYTVAGGSYATPDEYSPFELKLNHPHVFEVTKFIETIGNGYHNIPLVVGEVVDPNFDK